MILSRLCADEEWIKILKTLKEEKFKIYVYDSKRFMAFFIDFCLANAMHFFFTMLSNNVIEPNIRPNVKKKMKQKVYRRHERKKIPIAHWSGNLKINVHFKLIQNKWIPI